MSWENGFEMYKNEKAMCKAQKSTVLLLLNMQICKVLVAVAVVILAA